MTVRPGDVLRLRMVNATNGESYVPIFTSEDGQKVPDVYAIAVDGIALLPVGAETSAIDLPIDLSNGSEPVAPAQFTKDTPFFHIDYDLTDTSQTHAHYWTTAEIITLAAAQRLDVLVKIPSDAQEGQVYQLKGAAIGDAPSVVTNNKLNGDPLVQIQVAGNARTVPQCIPTMELFDNAQNKSLNNAPQNAKIERPPMAPAGATPAPTATQSQWYGYVADDNIPTENKGKVGNFLINGEAFDADLEDPGQVQLKKDELTAWELYSVDGPHIFHIHINSFAVHGRYYVAGNNTAGTPGWPEDQTINGQTVKGWPVAAQGAWPTPSWCAPYLMPIWRDTLYFDSEGTNPGTGGDDFGVTGMRALTTSYQVDYTGEFVLHCHKLFHEDNGMMYTVQITADA
jgi:L-ascorbate oxidase